MNRMDQGRIRPPLALCLLLLVVVHGLAQEPAATGPEAALPAPAAGQADPSTQQAQLLIQKLGDPNFGVRQLAYEGLMRLGRPALPPLAEALGSSNPEIQTRASEILIRLRGRGFLGIRLQEDWEGEQPVDLIRVGEGPAARPKAEAADEEKAVRKDAPPLVQVMGVEQQFPAAAAGVLTGDRVLSVNGQTVRGMLDLMRIVILAGPATEAMLVVLRDEKKISIPVRLGRNPNDPPPRVDLLPELKQERIQLRPIEE